MKTKTPNILLFDGHCPICNRLVMFILKRDKAKIFSFCALQSPKGQECLESYQLSQTDLDSVVLIKGNKAYQKSSAILQVFKDLKKPWSLLYVNIIIPLFMRDAIYDIFAKSRYRLSKRSLECQLPGTSLENYHLSEDGELSPIFPDTAKHK